MFLDNEVFNLYIKYLGKEVIKTRYGTFNAIKFKPLLVKGTLFEGGEKMTVWVSDDANHIPLRVESPIVIGSIKAEESVLDQLLAGDLDSLLLGIIKATFGVDIEIPSYCDKCEDYKIVTVDLNEDVKVKILTDPINDRVFTVKGKKDLFTVQLPTGSDQKQLIANADKSEAEQTTILLQACVLKINDNPVYSALQVQHLGMVDRKNIVKEINKRVPGPQFTDLQVTCPECEGEVTVSINLGTLFRL
jgi:hypothetical protein